MIDWLIGWLIDFAASNLEFKTLAEQVARFRYLIDIQGKGYSSRLKLLLHSGRPIFIA